MALQRKTLSEQLYETLKDDIISHKIKFGQKLINRDLQTQFGVSSTPVRDAINHLYIDGLVDNITNSGARVIDFDLRFTLDVNEMVSVLNRAAIENCAAAETLCETGTKLQDIVQKQRDPANMKKYYHYDSLFHSTLFEACKNVQLRINYTRYLVLWEMLVRRYHEYTDMQADAIDQHAGIADACARGDEQGALAGMKAHFALAATLFDRYMK